MSTSAEWNPYARWLIRRTLLLSAPGSLRHVTGFTGLGLLRTPRPAPAPSADSEPAHHRPKAAGKATPGWFPRSPRIDRRRSATSSCPCSIATSTPHRKGPTDLAASADGPRGIRSLVSTSRHRFETRGIARRSARNGQARRPGRLESERARLGRPPGSAARSALAC